MKNSLGKGSRKELIGVHSDMVIVVTGALELCGDQDIDFTVFDGIRTLEDQKEHVKNGVSWTLKSMHLPQKTGYGHAVDLYPYINGKVRPEAMKALQVIGKNMKKVAKHHGIPIIWGALKEYGGDWTKHNDGYHFELNRKYYL